MYQVAQVRMEQSHVCFSVNDGDEARQSPPTVAAISVERITESGWEAVWSLITPLSPPTTLHPADCIPFGADLAGGKVQWSGHRLQPGERYNVGINAQIANPAARGDPTLGRMYSRDFCLRARSGQQLEVILVPRAGGETQWRVCD
jgi:hypothetical protein